MRNAVVALLSLTTAACARAPTDLRASGTRFLPTLSLLAGQSAAIDPKGAGYDSLAAVTSSAVAFVGSDTFTVLTPRGGGFQVQVFHFQAMAPGQAVVTIRNADGTPAVEDTVTVQAAAPHGAFAQVNAGLDLPTCAVTTRGTGYCWGLRSWQVSVRDSFGDGANSVENIPRAVTGGLAFAAISDGQQHICGVTTGGAAYCWGVNFDGQLGDGGTDSSTGPVLVSGGLTFTAVSAGIYHTCGLATGGAIYCWGNNYSGALGNGTAGTYVNSTPAAVSGDLTFVAVTASYEHTCGLTATGAAYCWGDNGAGELGTGDTILSTVPVPVTGGLSFVALSAGYAHGCGLTQSGAAYCWGNNGAGEIGHGTTTRSLSPVAVSGGLTFASISAGEDYTCGVTTGGVAYCWGDNNYGQLGNSANLFTHNPNPVPLPVSGGLTFQTVSAGYLHTCGVTTAGSVYCWGDNSEGELGNGSLMGGSVTPVLVSGP